MCKKFTKRSTEKNILFMTSVPAFWRILLRTMVPLMIIWLVLIILFLNFFDIILYAAMYRPAINSRVNLVSEDLKNADFKDITFPQVYEQISKNTLTACILFDENGTEILHNNLILVEKNSKGQLFGFIDGDKMETTYLTQIMNKSTDTSEIYLDSFRMDGNEIYPEKITVYSKDEYLGSVEISLDSHAKEMPEYTDLGQQYKIRGFGLSSKTIEMANQLAQARKLPCYAKMSTVENGTYDSRIFSYQPYGYEIGTIGGYRYLTYLSQDNRKDMHSAHLLVILPTFFIFMTVGLIISCQFKKIYQKQLDFEEYRKEATDALAHELKTPLAIISGYAQNLLENVQNEKREHYAKSILDEAGYMDGTITQMLKISKQDAPTSRRTCQEFDRLGTNHTKTDVDLMALSKVCIQRFSDTLAKRKMSVDIQGTGHIYADETWIQCLIDNLISNAIYYGTTNTVIHVKIEKGCYTVSNTCEETLNIDKLWQPYTNLGRSRTNTKSTGLGLSIVKRIGDAHGFQTFGKQKLGIVEFGFNF